MSMSRATSVSRRKGASTLAVVLIVIACVVVVIGTVIAAAGWFVFSKVKEAGLDPAEFERNPGLAITKMIAALNPNIEILEIDEDGRRVQIRDKESGKTIWADFDDLRNGNIRFEDEEGREFSMSTSPEGEGGTMNVETPEGSYQIGGSAAAELPDWLPQCQGCTFTGVMTGTSPEGRTGTVAYKTAASPDEVLSFYESALKGAQFTVNTVRQGGAGGMLSAEAGDGKRNVIVIAGAGEGSITFNEKD